ncbi:hypothetical protein KVF89_08990 [Nocardioides carbamazepini]|uniref:hypothetical protein n=1 Tax=Nocardioides carbamazepini TaxID=2854259 RepID=UPI00214A706B|nr:hypothetical protein [Nocardioides carbamazepini]MCR1782665.1 hypothetical protein [Nocardioides carbamazepini]
MTEVLLVLAGQVALTGLPMCAGAMAAVRRGLAAPTVLCVALLVSGLHGLIGFWAYYSAPEVGRTYSWAVLGGSALLLGVLARDAGVRRRALRVLATPLLLWVLAAAFLLMIGFAHGGTADPITMAATRFSHPLPADNAIPYYFADWFYAHGHTGTPPLFADWLASDRPPLQLGYVLAERPFEWTDTALHYQVLGVLLQQLWVVGLWALLLAARLDAVTRSLVTLAVLLSDLVFVNGFFVWPKLLPAGLALAAAALVLTPLWQETRRSWRLGALLGALVAVAMLGHGSTAFGLIGIAVVALVRGLPSVRFLAGGVAAGLLLMVPWSLYQAYDEPPANRLGKWMFAGQIDIDARDTPEAVRDSYAEIGLEGALENKAENIATITGWKDLPDLVRASQTPAEWVQDRRHIAFFDLLPSLGLLAIGPLALLGAAIRRRGDPARRRFAGICLGTSAVSIVVWGLLLFGNDASRTTVHVGSYVMPILLLVASVVGLRAALPRFAVGWVLLAAATTTVCYLPSFQPLPGTSYSPTAFALAGLALAGFCAALAWSARREVPADSA